MDYSQVTVDILQNPKYQGAIDSVRWLTNWMDSGFVMVISIVAYLIIIVAMLKNILAAADCSYPRFWEKVHNAHLENADRGWITQFQDFFGSKESIQKINSGSFRDVLLRILPDVRAWTDFDGAVVAPRAYWSKAIPLMLVSMLIAAFLYNGFYRDVAAKVVDFGSEMASRVLLEVDPIAVWDQFTGASGRPTFSSDGSEIESEKLVNKVATNAYNAVIGEYNDISGSDAKKALAATLEGKVRNWIEELASIDSSYVNGKSWKPVIQVSLTNGPIDVSQINGRQNEDGTVKQYANQFPVSDLHISSNKNVNVPMYVRMRVNFEKKVARVGNHPVEDVILHLPTAEKNDIVIATNKNLHITGANSIKFTVGKEEAGTIRYDAPAKTLTINWKNGVKHGDTLTLSGALQLVDNKNGVTHHITLIKRDGASQIFSSPSEGKSFGLDETALGVTSDDRTTKDTTDAALKK